MRLVLATDPKMKGDIAKIGDKIFMQGDRRPWILEGIIPPKHPGSGGKLCVRRQQGTVTEVYYPSVFGFKFVEDKRKKESAKRQLARKIAEGMKSQKFHDWYTEGEWDNYIRYGDNGRPLAEIEDAVLADIEKMLLQ